MIDLIVAWILEGLTFALFLLFLLGAPIIIVASLAMIGTMFAYCVAMAYTDAVVPVYQLLRKKFRSDHRV